MFTYENITKVLIYSLVTFTCFKKLEINGITYNMLGYYKIIPYLYSFLVMNIPFKFASLILLTEDIHIIPLFRYLLR